MNQPEIVLDCRGHLCPRPVIELARSLHLVPVGHTIAVAADDVAASSDIPAWCRMREQEFLGSEEAEDGVPIYLVRRLH